MLRIFKAGRLPLRLRFNTVRKFTDKPKDPVASNLRNALEEEEEYEEVIDQKISFFSNPNTGESPDNPQKKEDDIDDYLSEPIFLENLEDLDAHLEYLETYRKPNLFQKTLFETKQDDLKFIEMCIQTDIGKEENIYKTMTEAYKLLATEPSLEKRKKIREELQMESNGLTATIDDVAKTGNVAVPIIGGSLLINILADPEVLPLQPVFMTAKFFKSHKTDNAKDGLALMELLIQGAKVYPNLLNYVGAISEKIDLPDNLLNNLVAALGEVGKGDILPLGFLPLLGNQKAGRVPDLLLLKMVQKVIYSMRLNQFHKQDLAADWKEWQMAAMGIVEGPASANVLSSLIKGLTALDSIEDRTRLTVLYFTILQKLGQPKLVYDLLVVFKAEFGQELVDKMFNTQEDSPLSNLLQTSSAFSAGTLQKLKKEGQFLSNAIERDTFLRWLLDVQTTVGYTILPGSKISANVLKKRALKSQITKMNHNLTIGEFESLKSVDDLVGPAEFVTHTSYHEFAQKVSGSDFEKKFKYFYNVNESNENALKPGRGDSSATAEAQARFFKGRAFRYTLSRKFSTENNPKNDNDAELEDPLPKDSLAASDAALTRESNSEEKSEESAGLKKNPRGKKFTIFTLDPLFEFKNLLESGSDPSKILEEFLKVCEQSQSDSSVGLRLFNTFLFADFIHWDAITGFQSKPDGPLIPFHDYIYDAGHDVRTSFYFPGETRLGNMAMDLNQFNLSKVFTVPLTSETIQRYIFKLGSKIGHLQYFTLLNLFLRLPWDKMTVSTAKIFLKLCVDQRWPKTLIQTLHLMLQQDIFPKEILETGLDFLAKFRYMAPEGVELFIVQLQADPLRPPAFTALNTLFESMMDNGQIAEAFLRYEDIKNIIQGIRYTEDKNLDAEKNEIMEKEFKSKLDQYRRDLASIMFNLAVQHRVTSQASLLFSEMMSLKSFRTITDAMNMLWYARKSQANLNLVMEYIKTDMKYEENKELIFPPEYVSEWLVALQTGGSDFARNAGQILRMFFIKRDKTPIVKEHLGEVLKFVLIHGRFEVLNIFLDVCYYQKVKPVALFGESAKSACLAVISQNQSEEQRQLIMQKLDRIFMDATNTGALKRTDESGEEALQAQLDAFKPVWESRLEKHEMRLFSANKKEYPRPRPKKDKRGFRSRIFTPMYEAAIQKANEAQGFPIDHKMEEWEKKRREERKQLKDIEDSIKPWYEQDDYSRQDQDEGENDTQMDVKKGKGKSKGVVPEHIKEAKAKAAAASK